MSYKKHSFLGVCTVESVFIVDINMVKKLCELHGNLCLLEPVYSATKYGLYQDHLQWQVSKNHSC